MGELLKAIPKFSELMPQASELTDANAIANLPALKLKYEQDEAAALERMRQPNPLADEDWGKSKMDIVEEAIQAKREEERKENLMKFLEVYNEELEVKKSLKAAKSREQAIMEFLDSVE